MNAKVAVSMLTIYLVAYVIVFATGHYVNLLAYMFLASPVLLIAVVYFVLTDTTYTYPELGEDQEWGYRDKNKNELGVF
jgi:fatty acid desaturase